MKVVAEGVEENFQQEYLKTIDCDIIQGFLISKALPGQEVIAFFEENIRFATKSKL